MNKKLPFRKILLLAALMLPLFALRAQNTSDTITSSNPFPTSLSVLPGYYGYHVSACLYTADEINHEAGEMTALSYSIAPSNGYYYDYSSAKIWLLETSENSIDLTETWYDLTNAATLVYDGTLSDITPFDYYWHKFSFSQPFEYNGGNLIVYVEGVMADEYMGGTDYEIGLYTNEGNESNCWILLQDDEMIDIHTALADLEGSYHSNNEYRPDIFFTFGGDVPGDCYLQIPYSENFQAHESYAELPTCWTRISEEYNSYGDYYSPTIGSGSAADNYNQNLFFMMMDTYSEWAILPELAEGYSVQDLTMSFKFKSAQQNTTVLAIGVMTDPTDTTTFQLVSTVSREGSVSDFEDKEINFASYTGEGRYIALVLSREYASSMFPSCFVDDLTVEASAFCTAPVNVTAEVDANSATISWTYTNNAQGVKLYYKSDEDADFTEVEILDDNYFEINDLSTATTYSYYLVSLCGDEVESSATEVYEFTTACDAITEFPWMEGFENGISCWTLDASATGQNWNLVSTGSHPSLYNDSYMPYAGNNMMEFNAWQYTEGNWGTLASPQLDLTQDKNLTFKYHACGPEEVFDYDLFEQYPDNEEMWWKPITEKIEVYVSSNLSLEDAVLLTTVNGYSDAEGWKSASVNIPALEDYGYVIFKAYYNGGFNMAIDNVEISDGSNEYETTYITIDSTICEGNSVVINNETFNTTGTFQITVSNENEGDTIITLNLTVNPSYSITYTETINSGETYSQHGFNENATGTYYQNLETVNGCDSIIILDLTVIGEQPQPVFVTVEESICDGESYEFQGSSYSAEGTYNIVSGDTTYTLVLTVNPTYNITINDSLVAGETYTNYGFNVSAAGTYTQNLTTVNGCDSIVTLILTEVVGVQNFDKGSVVITPNPATDHFYVSVKGADSDIRVELLDMSGRVLRREKIEAGEQATRIERGDLPSGIYMLRMISDKSQQTRKVILK